MASIKDADFLSALDFDLDHEGRVYEDVPGDSGGPTKWGITWIDGNNWRREHSLPVLTIAQARSRKLDYLTPDIISEIYFKHYWLPMIGATLPTPLDTVIFDGAVNMGTSRVVKMIQAVLGVKVDGQLGPQTEAALNKYVAKHGQDEICFGLIARRRDFYKSIATGKNAKFLKGWLNRCDDLEALVRKSLPKSP